MKEINFDFNGKIYNIQIGENKYENVEIIDKANLSDIWFHVKDESSCHVILKNELKIREVPLQVVKRCAYLCKINSKAKKLKLCEISYTYISNISKTDIIGQVIVTNHKKILI